MSGSDAPRRPHPARDEPAAEPPPPPDVREDPRSPLGTAWRKKGVRSDRAHPLGEVLDAILVDRRLARGVPVGRLVRDWEAVVGPALAAVTLPLRLDRGTLMVRASTAAWAAQVRFLSKEIAGNANALLGRRTIANVQVTVGGGPPERS